MYFTKGIHFSVFNGTLNSLQFISNVASVAIKVFRRRRNESR